MFNPIRWFLDLNKKCFQAIAKYFPQTKFNSFSYYSEQVKNNISEGNVILDIGGGKKCGFASEKKNYNRLFIIALDISQEELDYNHDVDKKILFDITSGNKVPLDDASVDMITSRTVLEHLKNLDNAFSEVSRILKPGGKFISLFPNKFALFAIINQILPHWLARKILFSINPGAKGHCGFRAYYNKCYYPAVKKLLNKNGFSDINFAFAYSQSGYFAFFLPFALISLIWDFMMYALHIKPMCSYICFTAVKRE